MPELILRNINYEHAIRALQLILQDEVVRNHMAELHEFSEETFDHCVRVAEAAVELSTCS